MLKIKIVTYGNVKKVLDFNGVTRWKSKLFSVISDIDEYSVNTKADSYSWTFSDQNLRENLPSVEKIKTNAKDKDADFVIFITNVPLENNYFSRILSCNQVVVSIYEIKDILEQAEVPLENFIIVMLYDYSLMFISSNKELSMEYEGQLAHNDARGCILNQCGNKAEVIDSCVKPFLCDMCKSHFLQNGVSLKPINCINGELRKLNRPLYYRLKHFIKDKPILALIISAFTAICLNIIATVLVRLLGF